MRADLAIKQMVATTARRRIEVRGGETSGGHLSMWTTRRGPMQHARSGAGRRIFQPSCAGLNLPIRALADAVAGLIPGTSVDRAIDDDDRRSFRAENLAPAWAFV